MAFWSADDEDADLDLADRLRASLEGSGGQTGYSASPSDVASFMSMGNTATAVLETPETIVEETVVEGNSDVSAEESSDVINDASTQESDVTSSETEGSHKTN